MKKQYVKVILYAYPYLCGLADASRVAASNKAVLSFRSYASAFDAALEVAEEIVLAERLESLSARLGEILSSLSEEERFLLEYKYFRRRRELARFGADLPYSERSYFRRQSALLQRVGSLLTAGGWTDKAFFEAFGEYAPFMRILQAIMAGEENRITAKRTVAGVRFQKSERSESGGMGARRFARNTKIAMPAIAAHARQMTTICTGVSPCEPLSPSPDTGASVMLK